MFKPSPAARALALGLLLPGVAQAALAPAGKSYRLTVTTSFEPAFVDCWTFGTNGSFIYSPRLHYFPYQLTALNTDPDHVQALWQGRVSIGFATVVSGTAISGDAVDALRRTYSFTGTQVTSCAGQPSASTGVGYLTH